MNDDNNLSSPKPSNFLFYATQDGKTQVRLLVDRQTVWMPQLAIAELFDTSVSNINKHLKTIYDENELSKESTIEKYSIVQIEGNRSVSRKVDHYNLEVILAVGYRVRSSRGTQFRSWATSTLKEYLIKGFVLDDNRLKAAETTFGQDYFDELLERIRDIRASERRFYQKVTDIFATSIDYDSNAEICRSFYATVQNKLEWAITGMTAAEIIHARVDANKPNLGLQTWKNAPAGKIRKGDVTVAKNYLTQDELADLNRIVSMYLDYAEDQAKRHQGVTMSQWIEKLDSFLAFNDREVLKNTDTIQKEVADKLATTELESYRQQQSQLEASQPTSDFDRFVSDLKKNKPDHNENS